jgi:hypothetical protein
MMTRCWKNGVVVLIALWLPLQGYGAVAMPFCKHGPAMPDAPIAASAHPDSQHSHEGHEGMHQEDPAAGHQSAKSDNSADKPGGLGCNDCGACQLACAPLIFSTVPYVVASGGTVYDPLPVASLVSVSPKQLQRPPLAALI